MECTCKNCKKTFVGKVNGKYCSKKCKKEFEKTTPSYKEAQRRYEKKRCERMRLANAQRNQGCKDKQWYQACKEDVCRNCQVDLSGFPRAKFFCSRKCQQQFNNKMYNATQRVIESKRRYEQNNKEKRKQWHIRQGLAGKLRRSQQNVVYAASEKGVEACRSRYARYMVSDRYVAKLIGLPIEPETIEVIQLAKASLMLKRVIWSKKENK